MDYPSSVRRRLKCQVALDRAARNRARPLQLSQPALSERRENSCLIKGRKSPQEA